MIILGISALYHDSAAALIKDGEIIAAAQEERFTRIKGDSSIPVNSIKFCLDYLDNSNIDYIAYYDNPLLTLDRWICNMLNRDDVELKEKELDKFFAERLWIHKRISEILSNVSISSSYKFVAVNHHMSHAASAFYPSPFKEAAILTIDGVGEWATSSLGIGRDNTISILKELRYPNSLGLLYSAFTSFCGFKVNFGEYKLMGLAPYGEPIWADAIMTNMVDIREDGSFALNLDYFSFIEGEGMYSDKFCELFNLSPREPESDISKAYADIAASIQKVTELIIVKMAQYLKSITNLENLVLAGGCALNCVANGVLQRKGVFEHLWIQPASNDAGGAIGAALSCYYYNTSSNRHVDGNDSQKGSFLGPEYTNGSIELLLKNSKIKYKYYNSKSLYQAIAKKINDNEVVGLFHGRMEFGPRALGHRSIIASAIPEDNQIRVNRKIKFRESFRPFAPAVLLEDVSQYFLYKEESPYMLLVSYVKPELRYEQKPIKHFSLNDIVKRKRSIVPSVTHIDYSARIQTVDNDRNPFFYNVLKEYKKISGLSVVLNTSFNVRGEPIVCTPEDALRCFFRTEIDSLVLGNYIIEKAKNNRYD